MWTIPARDAIEVGTRYRFVRSTSARRAAESPGPVTRSQSSASNRDRGAVVTRKARISGARRSSSSERRLGHVPVRAVFGPRSGLVAATCPERERGHVDTGRPPFSPSCDLREPRLAEDDTPAWANTSPASAADIARSSAPTSSSWPRARRRPNGSGGRSPARHRETGQWRQVLGEPGERVRGRRRPKLVDVVQHEQSGVPAATGQL